MLCSVEADRLAPSIPAPWWRRANPHPRQVFVGPSAGFVLPVSRFAVSAHGHQRSLSAVQKRSKRHPAVARGNSLSADGPIRIIDRAARRWSDAYPFTLEAAIF